MEWIVKMAAVAALSPGLAWGQSVVLDQSPASSDESGSFANIGHDRSLQRLADDFTVASATSVTGLSWWGFTTVGSSGSDLSNVSAFRVEFFDDDGVSGAPGTQFASFTLGVGTDVTATVFGTNGFNGPTYRFDTTFVSGVTLPEAGRYWVAINAIPVSGSASSPVYSWMGSGRAELDRVAAIDGLFGVLDGVYETRNLGSGLSLVVTESNDADGDGLSDADEALLGTDPQNPDSDFDGLSDGEEADLAAQGSCLSPLIADSDGDGLLDGDEQLLGLDACNADSDDDMLPDGIDPDPLNAGGNSAFLQAELRSLSDSIRDLPLESFDGPNEVVRVVRRAALANRVRFASFQAGRDRYDGAWLTLSFTSLRVDGEAFPRDWMSPGTDRDLVAGSIGDALLLLDLLR